MLDASWIPLVSLIIGVVTAIMLLRVFAAVFSQALAHYALATSARRLRNTHIERLREIERAIKRERDARAAVNEQRSALMHAAPLAPDEGEINVDILEAA